MSVNFFLRSLVVAVLVTASASAATTTWNGSSSSDWTLLGNWTSTVPNSGDTVNINAVTTPAVYPVIAALTPPAGGNITAINLASTTELTLNAGSTLNTSALTLNATGSVGSTVTVNDGARLIISSSGSYYWSAGTANFKGTVSINRTLYVGSGGTAAVPRLFTINVTDGGSYSLGNQNGMILGNNSTGTRGVLNVWGKNTGTGTTSLVSFGTGSLTIGRSPGTGLIDLRNGGRLEYGTQQQTSINNGITAGTVVPGDPRELLVTTLIGTNRWRLTTYENNWAYQPVPVSAGYIPANETLVSLGTVAVSFKAPLARDYGDDIECRVYNNFATGTYPTDANGWPTYNGQIDPNGDSLTTYTTITRPAATALTMTSAIGGKYVWRVDCIDHSKDGIDPNYPITSKGTAWYFKTGNAAPVAVAGPTQNIGLVAGSAAYTSVASITDDGLPIGGAVTGQWTQVQGPAVAGMPVNVTAAAPNLAINLTTTGRYVFRLIGYDTSLYGAPSDTQVNVFADSCLAAKAGTWTAAQGDFNADCVVNAKDLALMVANWLGCSNLMGCE